MTLRALIVDDERLARVALRGLLARHGAVQVAAEADGVESAAEALAREQFDVVFLDVHMPPASGFDLFARCEVRAHVVFVTAYDTYALRAFEVNALDYLLKPVSPERLAETVARIARAEHRAPARPVAKLELGDRVCVPTSRGARFFRVEDLDRIRASDDYAELVLRDGTTLLSSERLSHWESVLPEAFVRVHRSTIVNIARVEEIVRVDSATYALRLIGDREMITIRRGLGPALIERYRRGLG